MRYFRPLLAVADRRDARSRNAERDQYVLDRLCAPLAEREGVFAGPALVAMALDGDADIGVAPQPFGLASQRLLRLGADIGAVIGEEHPVTRGRRQVLLAARAEPGAPPWTARTAHAGVRVGRRRAAAGGER